MTVFTQSVPSSVISVWDKLLKTCNNPLGITEEMLEESLKVCPPVEYEGGTFMGRYLVPNICVRYNPEEQPRDKSNDATHVNALVNSFSVSGYSINCAPPIASFDEQSIQSAHIKPQSGFNRHEALDRLVQELYVYDLYSWESKYDEVVARNQSNHHKNPALCQTKEDYLKEVCNAVAGGLVDSSEDAINSFVDKIAADKTAEIRKWIKKSALQNCSVYPNFRTYNSQGKGKNTLQGFFAEHNVPKAGISGRSEEEIKQQGCITYCAGNGDNFSAWGRGVINGTKYGVTTWIFGYAPNRVPDLTAWRYQYKETFESMRETFLDFVEVNANDGDIIDFDDSSFCVKFAGFLAQYVKPNPHDSGKPTEQGLVDFDGNPIKFNPDGPCLTTLV